ncbi:MAG: SusC/RagA family TonB-linked outer membrane protein, partial [Prevotellaceae bacterium]|nr:SusC/RagA family TonB-linked outer membrane protein [Prevotellaceae bacterium]
ATAIYGSRANSGVVIITTRSGKKGKTRIDVNGQSGIGYIAHDIPVANVAEYKQVMQTAIDNTNVQQGSVLNFFIPAEIQETNWLNEIYRQPAYSKSGTLMLSGGNDKTLFYTSLGYIGQQGAVRKSDYNQYSFRTKFEHTLNNIFKLRLNISGSYSRFDQVEDSDTSLKVIRTAREEQPWYSPYKPDGSYKVMGVELLRHNPVVLVNEEDWIVHKKQGVLGTALDITPVEGLKYTPSVNLYGILDEVTKKITEKHDPRKFVAGWAALDEAKNVSFRYVIDNIISYENEYKKIHYSLMAGHSFEKYEYETFGAKSDNYANEAFPSSSFNLINSGTNIYAGTIGYNAYAIESYFGRVALNYDNRYILNSTVRRDGASRFSKLQRYGTFPSLSFAWIITNEKFMPKDLFLDDLKLRASWGVTGSMAGIGNFAALSLVSSGGSSYNGSSGFRISQDAQNLTWEKANQMNLGFDAELFSGRINLTFDAFYSKTTDLLYNKPINATTGYTLIAANIGTLENKGLEFLINGKVLTKGEFKWDASFNISFVQNKLLSLIDGQDMYVMPTGGTNLGGAKFALINGKPITAYYMLKMNGIYQRDDEVPAKLYAKGVRAGDVKYDDVDKDGDISEADRQYVGKAIPDFYGGFTSNMKWRNFELNIFAQFAVGGQIFSAWKGGGGTEGTEHLGVAYSTIKGYKNGEQVDCIQFFNVSQYAATHYWRGEGTSNTMPRPVMKSVHTGYAVDYNTQTSTRYLENASYFKIKSVTLSYSLPQKMIEKIKINYLRLYAGVDNLLTFTKYSGYDPEFSYQSNPGSTNYGTDWGELPTLRNWFFGVNIKF